MLIFPAPTTDQFRIVRTCDCGGNHLIALEIWLWLWQESFYDIETVVRLSRTTWRHSEPYAASWWPSTQLGIVPQSLS